MLTLKSFPIPMPQAIGGALWVILSMSAYADVDYSLLATPTQVNETVDVNSVQQLTESLTFNSEANFVSALNNNLLDDFSIYRLAGTDPQTSATFNIAGGNVTLVSDQGSGAIRMTSSVPLFNHTFNGATRDESSHLLKQWVDTNAGLIKNPGGGQTGGSKNGASTSSPQAALNPIYGGGPLSPVSYIPAAESGLDNNGGFTSEFLDRQAALDSESKNSNLSLATRFSNYCVLQKCTQFYSFPIGFTKELGNEWAVLFKLPLTYIDSNGIATYSASLSTGLRIPVSRYLNLGRYKWDVIPLVSLGGLGSDQPGTATNLIYSGGLQSNFGFMMDNGYALIIQNQYNHFVTTSSAPFVVNEQVFRGDIINDVFRNGVKLAKDFNKKVFGRRLTASFFVVDTHFSGDLLAITNQQEFGFDVGLRALAGAKSADFGWSDVFSADKIKNKVRSEIASNDIKLGLTYTRAKNVDSAISVNLGWTF